MRELFQLNKYFYRYKWHFIIGSLLVAGSNYFRILQPQKIGEAINLVTDKIGTYKAITDPVEQSEMFKDIGGDLLYFGGLVLLFAFLMGVLMYYMRQTIIAMSRRIEYDMRNDIFAHYERLTQAFYKKNNTGDLMARISEDVSKVRMYIGPALMYFINLTALFSMTIYSMYNVSPTLTMWSILPLPFLSISIYYVSNLINKKSERIQSQLSTLNSSSQEVYSGIRVLKSYVQEDAMSNFFSSECETYKEKSMSLARTEAMFHPLMLLLIGASTLLTIYVGGLEYANGLIKEGNIVEFIIYVNMLTWPVTAIGWIASIVQRAAASQKRINEFMQTEPAIVSKHKTKENLRGEIRFDKVSFTYPDTGIQAIKEVSFHLKKGEKMAIVGRTGSGKTTIADLLTRMYDVTGGAIEIDDKTVQEHSLDNIRDQIGYVPQDVFLFSDTVSENIAFGVHDVSQAKIEEYCKYAAVHDDILSLSDGYDTIVGERGVTLSGGQKQRISIARALIKQPKIVLLDDCLSAVDAETEQQITAYLSSALKDTTTIIITHRIYASMEFDKIIVLEEGKIVEEGTHEDLLRNEQGFYREMYEQQRLEREENTTA